MVHEVDCMMAVLFYFSLCRFEQYVDYALDVPMYFVYRKKKYIDCTGMSFRVSFYPL
jgi:glutamate--cysteine ligase